MYEKFAPQLFSDLKETSNDWLRSTRDRFIFETFIMQAGESKSFISNENFPFVGL
jgi:hypothetical protein